jgi:4'-phosphopantetheinyl transferase
MRSDTGVVADAARMPELAWSTATPMLEIGFAEVHLWRVATTPADTRSVDDAWMVLGDAERHRALSYRDDRAARGFVVARARLRSILGHYLGCEPADVALEEGRNGRPYVRSGAGPGLDFSVSRVSGAALVALVGDGRVGVDMECVPDIDARRSLPWRFVREHAPPGLLGDLGDDDGAEAFCIAWTRLEAYAKAFTDGLGGVPGSTRTAGECCHVRSFRIDGDLVGSLAETGPTPRTLRAFDIRHPAAAT